LIAEKNPAWAKEHEAHLETKRQLAIVSHELEVQRDYGQDLLERSQATPDADGVAGKTAILVLRDKNLTYVVGLINRAPTYPWWPDDPSVPPAGWRRGRQSLKEHLYGAFETIWLAPADNATKVRLKHEFLRLLADEKLNLMMRPDSLGAAERSRVICQVEALAVGFSVPLVYQHSQEVMVDPVQVERRQQQPPA
jgi:hypothetical protein